MSPFVNKLKIPSKLAKKIGGLKRGQGVQLGALPMLLQFDGHVATHTFELLACVGFRPILLLAQN